MEGMLRRFGFRPELGKVLLFQRHDPFAVQVQCLVENTVDGADGNIFFRIELQDLHTAPAAFDQHGMIEPFPFNKTEIRSAVLFIDPKIAEHLPLVTKERHAVFP